MEDGTPVGRVNLCESCSHGRVARGHSQTEAETTCYFYGNSNGSLPFEVASCSQYWKKDTQDLKAMKDIAWDIKVRGAKVGFIRPGDEGWSGNNRL